MKERRYSSIVKLPKLFYNITMYIRIFCFVVVGIILPVLGHASLYTTNSTLLFASQYLAADYANRHHDAKSAARLFQEMSDQDTSHVTLLTQTYRSFLSAGDIPHAELYAKRALSYDPSDDLAYLLVTLQLFQEKDFSQAQQRLQERILSSVSQNDGSVSMPAASIEQIVFPYLLLWAKAGEGRYQEAIADAEAMLKEEAKGNEYFIYFQVALLADIAGDVRKAARYFEKGIATSYHPYAYMKAAGNFYERQGNSKRAKEIYRLYQAEHPYMGYFTRDVGHADEEIPPGVRTIDNATEGAMEVLAEMGKMLFGSGLYLQSVGYLHMVRHAIPDHHDAIILLSAYYGENEQYANIARLYQQVRPDSDLYRPGKIYWAEHLYRKGQKALAIKQLLMLSQYPSVHHFALITLADLLRKDNEYGYALRLYDRVIGDIKKPQSRDWVLFFARGICYERTKQWEKSESDFRKALELQPDQSEVLNYLGYSLVEQGVHIAEAKAMIEKALAQRPEDPQMIDSMGWALYRLQDYDQAAGYIEKALELSSQDAVINDHLGDIYWYQGRKNEARFQWKKALKYKTSSDMLDITYLSCKLQEGLPCTR